MQWTWKEHKVLQLEGRRYNEWGGDQWQESLGSIALGRLSLNYSHCKYITPHDSIGLLPVAPIAKSGELSATRAA